MSALRHVLLGAHLRAEDVAVEGVVPMQAGPLVLSTFPVSGDQNLASREVVGTAARLRQELAAQEIFVGIRYGATARDQQDALRKCEPHIERWTLLLERWRGYAELTLKAGGAALRRRPDRNEFASGAEYMRALHALRHSASVDPAFLADAETRLGAVAAKLIRRSREDGGTEIALLVRREHLERAREAAEQLRREHPSVAFLLSGPWPLEVFADET